MKLIGSGTKHQADHRAAAPVFGAHRVFFYSKFLEGIGGRLNHHCAVAEFVVVQAVQKVVVVKDTQAVHRQGRPWPVIVG